MEEQVKPSQGARHRIAQEHAALRLSLERLGALRDPRELLTALEDLRPRLVAHFESEEGSTGLHQVIGESASHMLPSLQRVYDEHREFLDIVDRLTTAARDCCEGPLAQILGGVRNLCDRLHEHEALESELLTEAVYTDLGDSS